jgi:flagellar motor switch protein FliM
MLSKQMLGQNTLLVMATKLLLSLRVSRKKLHFHKKRIKIQITMKVIMLQIKMEQVTGAMKITQPKSLIPPIKATLAKQRTKIKPLKKLRLKVRMKTWVSTERHKNSCKSWMSVGQ